MPEVTGRLRTPRLTSAPSSPVNGEMYYNTITTKLYWWNGTAWIDSTGDNVPDGSVTTAKFAAGAKAPDADKIDGRDSTDFAFRHQYLCNGAQASGLPYNIPTVSIPFAVSSGFVWVTASVYASTGGQVAVEVGWDGVWTGQLLRGYCDGLYTNRRTLMPAVMGVGAVSAGVHTINFRNAANALGDGGDWVSAFLFGNCA